MNGPGSGQVMMGNGKLFGVTVRDASSRSAGTSRRAAAGELRLHDASAQASRGRLTGQADLDWGETARLEGQARFNADRRRRADQPLQSSRESSAASPTGGSTLAAGTCGRPAT